MSTSNVRRRPRQGAAEPPDERTDQPDVQVEKQSVAHLPVDAKKAAPPTARAPTQEGAGGSKWKQLLTTISVLLLAVGAVMAYFVHRLGWLYFVPKSYKMLHLTPDQVKLHISNHTFLFVGGPHRGGTTILWECLRAQPAISGFPDKIGADYSEGMFVQTVYPTMGIGEEMDAKLGPNTGPNRDGFTGVHQGRGTPDVFSAASKAQPQVMKGLGRFAFNPDFHLSDNSTLITDDNRAQLFNEWGYFWNVTRPVLLEKSPPNMITTRFLQKMFSPELGAPEEGVESPPSSARFVVMTRHPLVSSLALATWAGPRGPTDLFELVTHWVVSHELLAADIPHLDHKPRVLKYEEFVKDPEAHVRDLLGWLGVPPAEGEAVVLPKEVTKDANAKYEKRYCEMMSKSSKIAARHKRMLDKLNNRVQRFGYDLNSFACLNTVNK